MDYRYNEVATRECHGHAHVDFLFLDDVVAIYLNVHHGVIFEGFHYGFHENGCERDGFAFALFELLLHAVSPAYYVGYVSFHKRSYVWSNALRVYHALGNHLAQAVHFNDFVFTRNRNRYRLWHSGGSGYCGRSVFHVSQNVFFSHAAIASCSGYARQLGHADALPAGNVHH